MEIDKKQLYTTDEVAEISKVSSITIKRYIADNKIPSIKFNGIRRIKRVNLAKILNSTKSLMPNNLISSIQNIDCVEGFKLIPDKSIDLILTDPPYGLNTRGIKNDNDLSLFYSILPESNRVLKDNSFFITFFSTKFLPDIFRNNPFQYFWHFVLYCPNGQVMSPIGFTKYMSCFVFKKGNPKMIKKGKDIFVDTPGKMIEPDEGFINHPTPKPKTFIKEILNMFSKESDIILDPFVGSGSTAVACKILKRNYIGFEINPDYCKLSENRISKF